MEHHYKWLNGSEFKEKTKSTEFVRQFFIKFCLKNTSMIGMRPFEASDRYRMSFLSKKKILRYDTPDQISPMPMLCNFYEFLSSPLGGKLPISPSYQCESYRTGEVVAVE